MACGVDVLSTKKPSERGQERKSVLERMGDKFTIGDDCWLWTGTIDDGGYGMIAGEGGRNYLRAHRVMYEILVGPIPKGMQLDHLCRVRNCVNPAHLEPVTPRENTLRSPVALAAINAAKTRCPRGHLFDVTYPITNTSRLRRGCLRCNAALARRQRQRKAQDGIS